VNASERQALLEEELLLVRHSGEIPEVALHASLHYLRDDTEGPGLQLTVQEIQALEAGVIARYQEIILRDLNVDNRKLSFFRGIRRANHNWYRFVRFSDKIGLSYEELRNRAAKALLHYLQTTLAEGINDNDIPAVNCLPEALLTFAIALGIDGAQLPENWPSLCEKSP
jgi:hypothetical protein